jgi:hypothetical protein
VKRHVFDPVAFVFGLLFAFLAVFVLMGNTLADLWPLWVWTLPSMTVGLLIVLYGVRRVVTMPPRKTSPGTPASDETSGSTEPDDAA